MGNRGLSKMDVDAFGTERQRACRVVAEVEERLFGVVVAVHSCYNEEYSDD